MKYPTTKRTQNKKKNATYQSNPQIIHNYGLFTWTTRQATKTNHHKLQVLMEWKDAASMPLWTVYTVQ